MSAKITTLNANGKKLSVINSDLLDKDKNVVYLDTVDQATNYVGQDGDIIHISDKDRGGVFTYNSNAVHNDGTVFGHCERSNKALLSPSYYGIPMNIRTTENHKNELADMVTKNPYFIDNLRQVNFHKLGALDGSLTFDIPDNIFRVQEASRSYDFEVGELKKVLFVGDSLTALNIDATYTSQVSKLIASNRGYSGLGYLSAETTVHSAKHNNENVSMTNTGGFAAFEAVAEPYSSDRRRLSPDGKGYFADNASGSDFIKFSFNGNKNASYSKVTVFYLQQPSGGTFTVKSRGTTGNTLIDTDGDLSIQKFEYTPTGLNGALEQYDFWIENATGELTIYGIYLHSDSQGFSYDVFAQSGKTLNEFVQGDYNSLREYLIISKPDTIVLNLGTNDSSQGRTVTEFISDLSTYIGNIETALSTVSVTPKFCIISPNNMQWTWYGNINLHSEFEDARRAYARANKYMYIDTTSEIGNFNYMWTLGAMKDGTHINKYGAHIIGKMVATKLLGNSSINKEKIINVSKIHNCFARVVGGVITELNKSKYLVSVTRDSAGQFTITHNIGSTNYSASVSVSNGATSINRLSNMALQSNVIKLTTSGLDGTIGDPTEFSITIVEIPTE